LKIYRPYCLLWLLAACGPSSREKNTLVHHRVFVLADTAGEATPDTTSAAVPADTSYLELIFRSYELVNVRDLDTSIHVKLSYAGTANFLKTNFYDGLRRAYLPCEVAIKLCNAQHYLKRINPGLSLLILDATRPLHIQQMMWDSLDMPPNRKFNYLSPPYQTSLHNYGCAVDLTILDLAQNNPLDMGTGFDEFIPLSQPIQEWKFLKSGELSREAFDNRRLVRDVMKKAGFASIPSEWWHFGYGSKEMNAAKFKLIK
jgi:D-alanyl-D-alanine dipeptidase